MDGVSGRAGRSDGRPRRCNRRHQHERDSRSVERGAERREGVLPCAVHGVAVAPFALRDVDDLRAISGCDLVFAMVSGLALAVHFASFFESLEWTTVAASVTLITTQPIFVGIGAAALLDERLTSRMVGGMVVACGRVLYVGRSTRRRPAARRRQHRRDAHHHVRG